MAYTKTTWVNNDAPYLNATNLNKMEDGIFNNDAAAATKINTANGSWTGTLTGDDLVASNSAKVGDRWVWQLDGTNQLELYNAVQTSQCMLISSNAGLFQLYSGGLGYDGTPIIQQDDYATDTTGGVIKIAVIGTDAYITTDGSTPGA